MSFTKPKTKHERNAVKALTRSKRNSPPGWQKTRAQIREERRARLERRKTRQAMPRIAKEISAVSDGMVNLGDSAHNTTTALKAFATANAHNLGQFTVPQLRELASKFDIKTTTKMRKAEIIALLTGTTK